MKNITFIVGIAISITFISCNEKRNAANDADPVSPAGKVEDKTIKGSVTNKEGLTLHYEFDNIHSTAVFTLNGEKIHMKQDTMASGIQYSNAGYKYKEHQGTITLTKNGMIIFENP